MPLGKILSVTKRKPMKMMGKTFEYKYNPKNKTYVKFEKLSYRK